MLFIKFIILCSSLIYALLITSHLGLGRKITAKDCGGNYNYGLRVAGCTSIKNEKDCKASYNSRLRDKKGNPIPACIYDSKTEGPNKCFNIIYPSEIHTSGFKTRYKNEVGNSDSEKFQDEYIDLVKETATDKTVESTGDIDYNPVGGLRAKKL